MREALRLLLVTVTVLLCFGTDYVAGGLIVAQYSFDTLDGTDGSGNGNDLTIVGATPSSRHGSSAFSFDGNDHMFVNDNASFDSITDAVTFAAWINPDETGRGYVMNKGTHLIREPFSMFFADNSIGLRVNTSDLQAHTVFASAVILPGTWTHVTGVYKGNGVGSGLAIYVNGSLDNFNSAPAGLLVDNAEPFRLGADFPNPGAFYEGKLDEVVIYNSALTSQEVSTLYHSSIVPEPSSFSLAGIGWVVLLSCRRRRRVPIRRAHHAIHDRRVQ